MFKQPRRTALYCLAASLLILAGPARAENTPDAEAHDTAESTHSAAQEISRLPWVYGPGIVRVTGGSTITLPKGYEMLSPPYGKKFLALVGNLVDETDSMSYIVQPEAQDKSWFMEFRYIDSGYVKDTDNIDAKELLDSMRESSIEQNKARIAAHLQSITLLGWQQEPHYDQEIHRLEWAYKFRDADNSLITNLNTRVLTRGGYYRVMLVGDVDTFKTDREEFNEVLKGLQPGEGSRYSDYKAGDKRAEYGLMGLIGGGAAAVAIKTGLVGAAIAFGMKLMTAIGAKGVLVAIFGFFALVWTRFKKLFSRKSED